MIKLLPYILFEKYNNILALEMASPWNRHCANCIGTLSLPVSVPRRLAFQPGVFSATRSANSSQHCRVTNQTTISLVYYTAVLIVLQVLKAAVQSI